jgi:hypothetical protein
LLALYLAFGFGLLLNSTTFYDLDVPSLATETSVMISNVTELRTLENFLLRDLKITKENGKKKK